MGYNFTLGKRVDETNEGFLEDGIEYCAQGEHSAHAPSLSDVTGQSNKRMPSYSAWAAFLVLSGLDEVFFEGNKLLIGGHPGYIDITPEIKNKVILAREEFISRFPEAIGSFEEDDLLICNETQQWETKDIPVNYTLARLDWLAFWIKHSLSRYSEVVLSNS